MPTAMKLLLGALLALVGAPPSEPQPQRYVALGDSYSSGTGTQTYDRARTCQRSRYAYPALVAKQHPELKLAFAACAGATTDDVLLTQAPRLDQATRLVTVTIGGNDVGFAGALGTCIQVPAACGGAIERGRSAIRERLPARLDAVYAEIARRAPQATVVVLGYPRLFASASCESIARARVAQLQRAADELRDVIRARVKAAGERFSFADAIPAFDGHGICARQPWINGLVRPVTDSYHPTRSGHSRGYAPLVLRALR